MKTFWMLVIVLFVTTMGVGSATAQKSSDRPVVRLDPTLDALVSPDAKLELVKGGFGFTEGALWVQQGKSGYLLFSDIPANVVYKWTPPMASCLYIWTTAATLDRTFGAWALCRRMGRIETTRCSRSSP